MADANTGSTRVVFGTLRNVDGQPQANALITFTLRPFGVTPTSIYPQGGVSVLTDDSGNFNTALWRNSLSSVPAQYRCTLPSGEYFDFILPGDTAQAINLSSLISLGVPSGSAQYAPIVDFIVNNPYLVGPPGGTPVQLGKKRAAESVPVVLATDQGAIPVIEQQKVATEVSLSLLGIPRSETALGIFGDVNTYNVNETEWAFFPPRYTTVNVGVNKVGWGVRHEPTESAAYVSAPGALSAERAVSGWLPRYAVLTSKRFFRYQPGRVSSATFGVRMTIAGATQNNTYNVTPPDTTTGVQPAPEIIIPDYKQDTHKKWGMFDNFNGYYFEIIGDGGNNAAASRVPSVQDLNFWCVRRFTSVNSDPDTANGEFGLAGGLIGSPSVPTYDMFILRNNRRLIHAAMFDGTLRCKSTTPGAVRLRRPTDTGGFRHAPASSNPEYTATDGTRIRLKGLFGYDYPASAEDIYVYKEYAKVYEQRIPRRFFNGDPLHGAALFYRYSSDSYIDSGRTYTEGEWLRDLDNAPVNDSSTHNIDFTRVTMYKIEYSWYGAVGAQFFAYVPDGNGSAKWVSIHHIRCSNQLSTPSLGNPTLPFRYVSYAGSSESRQDICKYGTSYLIDGGDKGTVKINSATTDLPRTAVKSQVPITPSQVATTNGSDLASGSIPLTTNQWKDNIRVNASGSNVPFLPSFINARLTVGSDGKFGTTIKNVSPKGDRIYLANTIPQYSQNSAINVYLGNGTPILGLQLLENIQNSEGLFARNRAQVYPTRLGVYTSAPCVLRLIKNPEFGNLSLPSGFQYANYGGQTANALFRIRQVSFNDLSLGNSSDITLTKIAGFHLISGSIEEQELTLDTATTTRGLDAYFGTSTDVEVLGSFAGIKGTLRRSGSSVYFSRQKSGDDYDFTTVFGKMVNGAKTAFVGSSTEQANTQEAYDHYRTFIPAPSFLPNTGTVPSSTTDVTYPRTGLFSGYVKFSAVSFDVQEDRAIVPGTGVVIATFTTGVGGNDYDLSPYFAYNKEYLSFPLVERGGADSLYLTAEPITSSSAQVLATLTWEEQ